MPNGYHIPLSRIAVSGFGALCIYIKIASCSSYLLGRLQKAIKKFKHTEDK